MKVVIGVSNWFNLELDTSPPSVVIYAVENGNTLEVRVLPLEPIDTGIYDAKAIDNGNNEYPFTLAWNDVDLEMQGSIDTSSFVNGVNRVEVEIYDEVHNSKISTKFINPAIIKKIIEWENGSSVGVFLGRRPYDVVFKDWNGTILDAQEVKYGEDAIPPTPSRVGYDFIGWDVSYENITQDTILVAQYSIQTFTVTFEDYNGSDLKIEVVNYGDDATPPSNPSRTGYNFTGWSGNYTNVTSNRTITATYSIKTYTVTFRDYDNSIIKSQTVSYGGSATPPSSPTRSGYRFDGWSGSYTNVTSNRSVIATYVKTYEVTFEDWDNTILKTQTVDSGGSATPPSNPSRPGYDFDGWLGSYTNVTSNCLITASYSAQSYRVRWYDWDGTLLQTDYYGYGDTVVIPPSSLSNKPSANHEWVGWECTTSTIEAGWFFNCDSSEDFKATWFNTI